MSKLSKTSRLSTTVLAIGLFFFTAAVFAPAVRPDFVHVDDALYVIDNTHLRGGLTANSVAWAFTTTYGANWFPLTWLTHLLDYQFFGLDPRGHYAVNLLLHAINAVLLFGVLRALTGQTGRSFLVAALFAVHPLRVESVAWVVSRKDVLSGLFFILALGAYLRYTRRPGLGRYLGVAVLYGCGLMAKPSVITLPAVFLLLDIWPLGRIGLAGLPQPVRPRYLARDLRRVIMEKLPLFALAAASGVVTYTVQKQGGAMSALHTVALPSRALNALISYAAYLHSTLWPRSLAIFYPYPRHGPSTGTLLAAIAVLLAATTAALALGRRRPWLAVGWAWYLGTLVPMIGLVQVGVQAMADRYTYLPHIGLFIGVVWGGGELAKRSSRAHQLVIATGVVAVAAFALTSRYQLQFWKDPLTLFSRAAAVTENNYFAENNLGVYWGSRGEHRRALEHFRRSLDYRSDYPEALGNLLAAQAGIRRMDPSGAAVPTPSPDPHPGTALSGDFARGNQLVAAGRREEAVGAYREAIRADPGNFEAWNNLGCALGELGRFDESAAAFGETLRLKPDHPSARTNLGQISELRRRRGI